MLGAARTEIVDFYVRFLAYSLFGEFASSSAGVPTNGLPTKLLGIAMWRKSRLTAIFEVMSVEGVQPRKGSATQGALAWSA